MRVKTDRTRNFILYGILLAVLIVSIVASLGFGAMKLSPAHTYRAVLEKFSGIGPESSRVPLSEYNIIWKLRMPRVLLAAATGAGLSLSGVIMQAAVQNPMASPYVLGLSAGASLGATIAVCVGLLPLVPLSAFLGAVFAAGAVLGLAAYGSQPTVAKLVLSGTVGNALFSAISNFIISMTGSSDSIADIKFWTMGSLAQASWNTIALPLAVSLICLFFFLSQYRVLNALLLGDEAAITLGLSPPRCRGFYMGVCALLTGILVSACGTIGFVGLIIPHLTRAFTGTDHRKLIPASFLCGAVFMIWADAFARSAVKNAELPIGIVTALIGAPFFAYMLIKKSYRFGAE